MKVAGIENESYVDGKGLRLVIFFQGCTHNCHNCHNPSTHEFSGGEEYTPKQLFKVVVKQLTSMHRGITLSGGDPVQQQSQEMVEFIQRFRKAIPFMDIWLYTGYKYEDISDLPLCRMVDVVVDGKYIDSMRTLGLPFRGSSNQRVIDTKTGEELL